MPSVIHHGREDIPYRAGYSCRDLSRCQQELYDQEEAKRKLKENQMEIQRMKTSGLQDKAFYDYTFAKDSGVNPEMALAINMWKTGTA